MFTVQEWNLRAELHKPQVDYDRLIDLAQQLNKSLQGKACTTPRLKPTNTTLGSLVRDPLLHLALKKGDPRIIKILLENKIVDPNETNEKDYTALMQACLLKNEEVVKILLEFGANPNHVGAFGMTPLHVLAKTICKSETEKEIITELAELLIKYKANVNIQSIAAVAEQAVLDGATALHLAAFSDNEFLVRLLLEQKIEDNIFTSGGYNPLHIAAFFASINVVQEISLQKPQWLTSRSNCNPIHLASKRNNKQNLSVLAARDQKLNTTTKAEYYDGTIVEYTSLTLAINNGLIDNVVILINAGANIFTNDPNGHNAFYYAAYPGKEEIFETILQYALKNNKVQDLILALASSAKDGMSALDLACKYNLKILSILSNYKINYYDHISAHNIIDNYYRQNEADCIKVIEALFAANPRAVNSKDQMDRSPLFNALNATSYKTRYAYDDAKISRKQGDKYLKILVRQPNFELPKFLEIVKKYIPNLISQEEDALNKLKWLLNTIITENNLSYDLTKLQDVTNLDMLRVHFDKIKQEYELNRSNYIPPNLLFSANTKSTNLRDSEKKELGTTSESRFKKN